jgi:hypothetical protein
MIKFVSKTMCLNLKYINITANVTYAKLQRKQLETGVQFSIFVLLVFKEIKIKLIKKLLLEILVVWYDDYNSATV